MPRKGKKHFHPKPNLTYVGLSLLMTFMCEKCCYLFWNFYANNEYCNKLCILK